MCVPKGSASVQSQAIHASQDVNNRVENHMEQIRVPECCGCSQIRVLRFLACQSGGISFLRPVLVLHGADQQNWQQEDAVRNPHRAHILRQ